MLFDVVDIGNDVILIDLFRGFVIVVGKYKTYFTTVIADSTLRVVFGVKVVGELKEQLFSSWVEGYFAQFFTFLKCFIII